MSSIRKNLDVFLITGFALGIGIGCGYIIYLLTGLQDWLFVGAIYASCATAAFMAIAWIVVNDLSDDPFEDDYPITLNDEQVEQSVGIKDVPMLFVVALLAVFCPIIIGFVVFFVAVNYAKNLLLRAVAH